MLYTATNKYGAKGEKFENKNITIIISDAVTESILEIKMDKCQ